MIGADGAHSVTRSALAAEAKPTYAGYAAWAGVLEDFEHELLEPNRHVEVWAHGSIGGVADLGRGRVRWYLGLGTPPGVGMGRNPPRFLQPGDVVTLGVEGLGGQRQEVVAPDGPPPGG